MPLVDTGQPAQRDACGPKSPARPRCPEGKWMQAPQLRNRVETNSQNEGADPAKNLGVTVRLYPARRNRTGRAMAADRKQVPNTQKSPRQQHECQAGRDIENQQAREALLTRPRNLKNLPGRERPSGLAFNTGWQSRHPAVPPCSTRAFHVDRAGEQDVVLQMNMLMQVFLKISQRLVERLVTDTGVSRCGVTGTGLA